MTTGSVASDDVIAELGASAEIELLRERIATWLEDADEELREPLGWALAGAPKHFRPLTLFACHEALLGKRTLPRNVLPNLISQRHRRRVSAC